jgi:uncharacterized protein (TIGR02246 family)
VAAQELNHWIQPLNHMTEDCINKIRSIAQAYFDAWSSQNPSQVAAFYELAGWLRVNDDPPAIGRNAITEVAKGFMTAFPDMKVVLDEVVLQDDEAVCHWTWTGTHTGPGGTGRPVRISGFEIWKIGPNGLIASSKGHFDAVEYRRQLGT